MVNVKIVNIRHLNGHISCINLKKEKYFFAKRNTIMSFHMYQIFSSLQRPSSLFCAFSFTVMEHFFIDHPISSLYILTKAVLHAFTQFLLLIFSFLTSIKRVQGHVHCLTMHFHFVFYTGSARGEDDHHRKRRDFRAISLDYQTGRK